MQNRFFTLKLPCLPNTLTNYSLVRACFYEISGDFRRFVGNKLYIRLSKLLCHEIFTLIAVFIFYLAYHTCLGAAQSYS